MKIWRWCVPILGVLTMLYAATANAVVGNCAIMTVCGQSPPPNGWDHVCSSSSIQVTQNTKNRAYSAGGQCWVDMAEFKGSDNSIWVQASVALSGSFEIRTGRFSEYLTFDIPATQTTAHQRAKLVVRGLCPDDPWSTSVNCAQISGATAQQILNTVGWSKVPPLTGPLSRYALDPGVISALLSKHESKPPLAPAGVDAVRWPAGSGKSEIGNIKWRAGDMSDNKWVMQFDVEYGNSASGSFTKGGQRLGLGPKSNLSAADANRVYVYSTPFQLRAGTDYFFRVCAVNDAGRQCSAPVKARPPTQMELASVASSIHPTAGMLGSAPAGRPPTAPPGAKATTGGFGAALRSNRGGTTGSGATTGSNGSGGFGSQRPVTVAGRAPTGIGGATPGAAGPAAKPDLAVARDGLLINDRTTAWNATSRLVLHPDASHTCPVHVSFRYTNLGKAAAANVIGEIRDSLQPTQPIATNTVASLAPGQSASISGVARINVTPAETRLIVTAIVRESGTTMPDANVANNRGTTTLDVLCQANAAGTPAPAAVHAPTSIGAPGAKRLGTMR